MIAATVATIIYLLLTAAALISVFSTFLTDLSAHGKTRTSRRGAGGDGTTAGGIRERLQHFLLTSDALAVNKRRFVDFYATGIVSTLILVGANIRSATHPAIAFNGDLWRRSEVIFLLPGIHRWLPTSLLMAHLIRRYCECRRIQKSESSSRMHLAGYLLGVVHYLCLPFVVVPLSPSACPNDVNDCVPPSIDVDSSGMKTNGMCDVITSPIQYAFIRNIASIIGAISCIYFQHEQHRHHTILANLRTKKSSAMYSIPNGRWFQYVSCPHYFSEIMIYFTFAILLSDPSSIAGGCEARTIIDQRYHAWDISTSNWLAVISTAMVTLSRLKHWILLTWVITNLSISANRSHEWYLANFLDYPRQRKRLIPFVW